MNLQLRKILAVVCLLTSFSVATGQQKDLPRESSVLLTNSEILELVNAGFSAETIIRRIKNSRCHFDTNASQLAELKSRGVPESVLRAMVEAPYGMPATQNENDKQQSSKNNRATEDPTSVAIQVPEGTFIFRKLRLRGESYAFELVGELENQTDKTWSSAQFKVVGIDENGNQISNTFDLLNELSVFGLKPGQTQTISKSLTGFERRLPTRVAITFRDGEYPAEYTFSLVKPRLSDALIYEDGFIQIKFAVTTRQVTFLLRNKTDNPISIDWNQVSYVDIAGGSHRVMHEGVKYSARSESQPPSMIPPTANLEDIVFPIDYVSYSSSRYSSGWKEAPLFPSGPLAGKYKDATFSVFMPLNINGSPKNYLFTFKIVNVVM